MAKVEEFKNKITKAQEELFKNLNNEKIKRSSTSSKIVQELSKLNKANVKSLNSLNKEYLEHCNNNNMELQTFVEKVQTLNNELQLGIDTYNETYNIDNEKKKLMTQKDKVTSPLRTKFKREIHDINIKIDRIDKELKEILETRAIEIEENNVNYKNKLIDYDKRRRYEVNKIQNNTIKEYDELQKRLLIENKRSEIKNIHKAIKSIRYNGLVEEKECIEKHLAEQKQFELDHAKSDYLYKCENIKLEKDYNTRIESVKFDRFMIEFNYKKEFDRFDNDVIHNLNEVNKKMQYKQNGMKEVYYENIHNALGVQYSNETGNIEDEVNVIKNIYNSIENMDDVLVNNFIELNNKELLSISNELDLFHKNINFTLSFYIQNIIGIYNAYFKDLFNKEENFLNTLTICAVKGEFLNGFTYDEYVNKVKQLFDSFKETEEETIKSFEEYLNNLLNNLFVQVESFIEGIKQLNKKFTDQVNEYHRLMSEIFKEAKENGISHIEDIHYKVKNEINSKIDLNNKEFEARNQSLEEERCDIEKEYSERENVVNLDAAKQQEEYKQMYSDREQEKMTAESEINSKHDTLSKEYSDEYQLRVKNIENKYQEELQRIDKEYKLKMGLL